MLVKGVIVAVLALMLVGVGFGLADRRDDITGSNDTPALNLEQVVPAGERVCWGIGYVAADTTALRVVLGSFGRPGGPPLRFDIGDGERVISRGRIARGWREGVSDIPMSPAPRTDAGELCVTNHGHIDAALGGYFGRPSLTYVHGEPLSWLDSAPAVLRNFAAGRAGPIGGWTLVFAAVLVLVAIGLTVRLILRERPE